MRQRHRRRRLHVAVGPTSLPLLTTPEHPVTLPATWTREAADAVRPPTEREAERLVNFARRGGFLEEALEKADALGKELERLGARIEAAPLRASEQSSMRECSNASMPAPEAPAVRELGELEEEMAANLREDLVAAGLPVEPPPEPPFDPDWDPSKIPGLYFAFRAEDAVDLGDGRVLMVDRSGNGRDTIVPGRIVESDPRFAGRRVLEARGGFRIQSMGAGPPAPDARPDPEPGKGSGEGDR